ncbi:MAG TPA: glycine oxidase ThiO [Armatimonadota bacterium]|jgi:glycine oxidase
MRPDVAIIGGGVIGCATAYYLARHGVSVVLLERGRVGEQASGASAGMLAPVAEAKRPGQFLDLVVAALRDYPTAVADIEQASGLSTGYVLRSILRVAFSAEDEAKFLHAVPMYEMAGLPYQRLTGDEARKEEPALSEGCVSAILSPEEGQVLPRQLVQAYRRAAERLGVRVLENTEVTDIVTDGDRVTGVRTLSDTIAAGAVVIAAGAWSNRFEPRLCAPIPVFPVRGQIVAVKGMPIPVSHVLYSYGGYAVPWPDGRLLLGATQEVAGYVPHTTVEGVQQVLAGGIRLVPGVTGAEIDEVWAGLRPGDTDALPMLGLAPGWQNAWLATGHFRNGILLGPYTARLLAQSIVDGKLADGIAAFNPDRQYVPAVL